MSPTLKFKQITSRVKDSHGYHSSSILSPAIIWGLTFLCNGACLCYAVSIYVRTRVYDLLSCTYVSYSKALPLKNLNDPSSHLFT